MKLLWNPDKFWEYWQKLDPIHKINIDIMCVSEIINPGPTYEHLYPAKIEDLTGYHIYQLRYYFNIFYRGNDREYVIPPFKPELKFKIKQKTKEKETEKGNFLF